MSLDTDLADLIIELTHAKERGIDWSQDRRLKEICNNVSRMVRPFGIQFSLREGCMRGFNDEL
jgi:hypothetical protein